MSVGHAYGGLAKKLVPPHLIPDLEILEQNFNFDKTFLEIIFKCFDQQSDPFTYALDLMFYSKDFPRGKSWSLSRAVLESLKKWCEQNDVSVFLTREQKADALDRVLQQTNGTLVGLVCEIFRLKEDCEYFKLVIKDLLSKKLYREAYYTITALNLERELALEEFCYPVFFLDKDTWLKNYLMNHPDLQLEFAKTLDAVCQSSAEIQEFISSFSIELNVKRHAYDPNRLQKRLSNLIETFNIDLKECPNLFQIRTAGAMNYLFRKRYIEESIAAEPWEELIVGILEDNTVLQKELLIKLVCISDNATALKLAKIFNLNRNDWPSILQNVTVSDSEEIESNVSMNHESPSISASPYLTLRLTNSDIHIVDTPDKFLDAVADISENYNVVGIDAEWKPNLGVLKEKLSLFQLAVWDSIYLLDILALQDSLKPKCWDYMIEKIFCNADILKLGYGIKTDLQMLIKLFSGEKSQLHKYPRLVDIGNFFKELKIHFPAVAAEIKKSVPEQLIDPPDSKGLSQLCYTILGKPLNKDEQFSNWERRPLRESQMTYAALDAYCLLMIYEKLYHVLRDMNMDFDKLMESPLPSKSVSENKKKTKKLLKKEIKHKPISVSNFRVVVDNMAHGLAKYLRICGADVVILDNDDDHMRAVEISQKENRIILSSGGPYEKLKGYVPQEMCFCLPIEANARVQAAAVLKHFNVLCKESDIFSRCSAFSEDSRPGIDLSEIVENGPSDQIDVASYSEESPSPVTSSSVTYCAEDIRHFDEDSSDEDCDIMYYD
ncbi:exonuclease mut-7 homolog isoform X2 [Stegodyphus dumicola]|uniref:exonuclease mut-7 homolog isoform X2 n=1 Tax=Stegodyphus dumicola TaxID=202533 RepID=UPI0015A782A6|nr:exonuclease mut-7 homolog isoform X2 [Stegodyphus dumicola]